jgi:hypothetical protein
MNSSNFKKPLPFSLLLFISLLFGFSATSQSLVLSDSAKVSMLTCSPGDELYSVFGHSAIRVSDPVAKVDIVFNYGTFDFSDPNFYSNFVMGRLNYILSVSYFQNFYLGYAEENRWIYEQELNITGSEKQFLLDSLFANYKPENRYYLYDFFYDNCATRIRNVFVEGIPRTIEFNYSTLESNKSFRELLMPLLKQQPWARFGINLALGLPSDRIAEPWDYMFLPNHMLTAFQNAHFKGDNSVSKFAKEPVVLLEGKPITNEGSLNEPLMVFLVILLVALAISYRNYKNKSVSYWFDRILFGSVGVLGVVLVFLWFFTDHKVFVVNFNVLWANPLYLLFILILSIRQLSSWTRWYSAINLALLVVTLLAWPLIPQALPWEVYPLVIALAVRFWIIYLNNNTTLNSASRKSR